MSKVGLMDLKSRVHFIDVFLLEQGVQPAARGPHVAQDGYERSPTQNCIFTYNLFFAHQLSLVFVYLSDPRQLFFRCGRDTKRHQKVGYTCLEDLGENLFLFFPACGGVDIPWLLPPMSDSIVTSFLVLILRSLSHKDPWNYMGSMQIISIISSQDT